MKTVLTIAGSDCSGGAGIQADLKTMTAHGVYGMSAITALTAQNTMGVFAVHTPEVSFLAQQLESIFADIVPDAVKIGMLGSAEVIAVTAQMLQKYQAQHIVLDPVMVSTSGSRLLQEDAITALQEQLLPMAEVITPNIPEAEVLTGDSIHTMQDMEQAADFLQKKFGCAVLCKGGHQIQDANDVLCVKGEMHWFYGERIPTQNTHGTGCTLSSAIACQLAKGNSLQTAIAKAKQYLSQALAQNLNLGHGSGPLNHAFVFQES